MNTQRHGNPLSTHTMDARKLLITSCKPRLQASLLWFPDIARSVVMGLYCKWSIAKSNHETDEANRNAATDQ